MTKREWVENEVGTYVLNGVDDDCYEFFYTAMKDYKMSFHDADRYAWLNTLFMHDIGVSNAEIIIDWLLENGSDAFEITKDDCNTLKEITEKEIGLNLDYSMWDNTAEYITYTW